jgi:hypothetical protein
MGADHECPKRECPDCTNTRKRKAERLSKQNLYIAGSGYNEKSPDPVFLYECKKNTNHTLTIPIIDLYAS